MGGCTRMGAVSARGEAVEHGGMPLVALVVVALALTALVAAGCGAKTTGPKAAAASPSAKAAPTTPEQFVAYLKKLRKYAPKGADSPAEQDRVFAQLKTLDWYDTAAVAAIASRLKGIAAAYGKARSRLAAVRPPNAARRSHQALLDALGETQTSLDKLASCMISHNRAEADMAVNEARYARQDMKAWLRLLKAEAKALKVKKPIGTYMV